jgi:hypothetical protein
MTNLLVQYEQSGVYLMGAEIIMSNAVGSNEETWRYFSYIPHTNETSLNVFDRA